MPASIGVNLRVTGHCRQGGRKYMEDFFSVAYQQTEDEHDLEYAFFGIYDGHGGAEAASFAKEHLMETIIRHKSFWSDNDEDVLRAIKDGYIATHYAMWKEQEKWPKTASGLPSTAGTTASVAFIRRGKIYIGHVGDSGIILGYQEPNSSKWSARALTRDHKPENLDEMLRINQCGGKVVSKSGVPRVVWNRPKVGHQGPVRRSTPIDEIPFLAVARSLGDLWSYNSQINEFIVSPDPDVAVLKIDPSLHRCLIFGTDGLFNMLSGANAVHIVHEAEKHNEMAALDDGHTKAWLNPSKLLVEKALERWNHTKMRADNTSVVTLMLDPPGPPRMQVLKDRKKLGGVAKVADEVYPASGLEIMTRFEEGRGADGECPSTSTKGGLDESSVSSSEIHNNNILKPLKERNVNENKTKEKVQEQQQAEQMKENCDSIQINEISSSSNECCSTSDNSDENRANKHNLRSLNNNNNNNNESFNRKKSTEKRDQQPQPPPQNTRKRKIESENENKSKLRKSLRLDEKKQAPASLAKRILRGKKCVTNNKMTRKLKKRIKVAVARNTSGECSSSSTKRKASGRNKVKASSYQKKK